MDRRLFEDFDYDPNTSVSKTINNYWWHLAAFFTVAIQRQVAKFIEDEGMNHPMNVPDPSAETLKHGARSKAWRTNSRNRWARTPSCSIWTRPPS